MPRKPSKATKAARKTAQATDDGDDPLHYVNRTRTMIQTALERSLAKCLDEMKRDRSNSAFSSWESDLRRVSRFQQELAAALEKADLWRSVYWALRFGSLADSILGTDAADALWRERITKSKFQRQTEAAKSKADVAADEALDRVAALVNCKGLSRPEAMKQVAKEEGITLRTMRRYARRKGQV